MDELQSERVEGLALDQWLVGFRILRAQAGDIRLRDLPPAVGGVADDGVADVGEVDAELVGAAGFGGEFEKGVGGVGSGEGALMLATGGEAFDDRVDGLGRFAHFGADGIFFANLGMDGQRGVDEVAIELEQAVDEGHVGFLDGAAFELAGDSPVGLVGFGDEDEAGGVAVEAVDDAGAPRVRAGGEGALGLLGVEEERIDERA